MDAASKRSASPQLWPQRSVDSVQQLPFRVAVVLPEHDARKAALFHIATLEADGLFILVGNENALLGVVEERSLRRIVPVPHEGILAFEVRLDISEVGPQPYGDPLARLVQTVVRRR